MSGPTWHKSEISDGTSVPRIVRFPSPRRNGLATGEISGVGGVVRQNTCRACPQEADGTHLENVRPWVRDHTWRSTRSEQQSHSLSTPRGSRLLWRPEESQGGHPARAIYKEPRAARRERSKSGYRAIVITPAQRLQHPRRLSSGGCQAGRGTYRGRTSPLHRSRCLR